MLKAEFLTVAVEQRNQICCWVGAWVGVDGRLGVDVVFSVVGRLTGRLSTLRSNGSPRTKIVYSFIDSSENRLTHCG